MKNSEAKSSVGRFEKRSGFNFSAWLSNHQRVAIDSFQRLRKDALQTLMTALVIAIALVLPCILYLLSESLGQAGSRLQQGQNISLYLQPNINKKASDSLQKSLKARDDIVAVTYVSPNQGLQSFQQWSGLGDVLSLLDSNPLPPVLLLEPIVGMSFEQLQELIVELKALSTVDDVQLDLQWVQRLQSMTDFAKRLVLALGGLLALGILLIIGNTIGLAIQNRRDEIVVVKLVGATDSFVRRPFLYTGLWYGLAGGLLAWLLIQMSLLWLAEPIQRMAGFYQSNQDFLVGLGFFGNVLVIFGAALLGLGGAWLAVNRHLDSIEPQ